MRAPVWLALLCTGCNAAWGIEGADSVLATDSGTGSETAAGPCDPQPGVAKVCLTFEGQPHPAYDVTTGAPVHRIDGFGVIKLYVFDEDPADPAVPYSSRLQLPLDGSELKVDDLPTTIPITLPPGRHWIIAQLEDNKITSRLSGNSYLAGDFVTVPTRSSTGRLQYPTFDAVADQATAMKVTLQPLRRVDVDLQADTTLRTTYKDYAVTGDGPIVFVLFDGEFNDMTPFLEFVSVPCVQAQPMSLMPPLLKSGFTTTVTGTHKLLASLEDYDSVSRFPTAGSLLTPDTMPPSISISTTSWTASASLKFVKVLNPVRATDKMDTQHCP